MEINVLLNELYSYSMHGIKLGLYNIQEICNLLGNPQNDYKIIHIAGTNGKGSTATTIETILIEAGYKVGKYTSPHILKFNERIRANGIDISDENIVKYYQLVKGLLKNSDIKPTFFEITTAMMFKYFSDLKLEYVVLETGMGGRYDATNIVEGDICVITNVTYDHTEYLGDTIYKIAKEKAGIIKNCKKVVVADNKEDFLKAIKENTNSFINVLEKYKNVEYNLDYERFLTKIFVDNNMYEFSLFGDYQVNNFLCAYEVAKILNIDYKIIEKAVKKVKWQCRFERYSDNPLVILDGAHNLDGVQELVKILNKGFKKDEIILIVSILKDKKINEMVDILEKYSDNIILTSLKENPRGLSGEELKEVINSNREFIIENDIVKAYKKAISMHKKAIVVCGSFYLLAKFKEEINSKNENI